jgi:glucose/mannose transport system substrate-binding protein
MRQSDGRYYSVPLNVHRNNLVWYNKALLDKHHIDPAALTTWDKLFGAARTLRSAGVPAPIQLGEAWTLTHLFECLMASLGLPAYDDWMKGRIRSAEDPRLLDALGRLRQYLDYVNKDYDGLPWDTALKRVVRGEAAFYTMGDWADGEFRQANLRYGVDYGAFPVPGTKTLYGATVDAFHLPLNVAQPTSSQRWLKFVVSRDAQDAFSVRKGSIPARTDADVAKYGPYQKSAIADFRTATLYPTVGAAAPEVYQQALDRILLAFSRDLDAKKAASALIMAGSDLAVPQAAPSLQTDAVRK